MNFEIQNGSDYINESLKDEEDSGRSRNPRSGGAKFLPKFPKNCMKLEEFEPRRGGRASPVSP